ncbi:hypothetical protein M8C21_003892 [Ambrosia artemisiifolia]|uniref:Agenet domain-containing protein n=1 Tax=Ambrosia artemisiifolia TaxID=4212 RepID=A0AAD5CPM5_AMBAR|nr:hypothetical protein M8C21_003892 [Ambrosia artemisiifolia]
MSNSNTSVTITKGSIVEVSSNEPGFYGAWYVATIVDDDNPPSTQKKSSKKKPKKLNKKGYLIKYHTLLKDGSDEPLTEVVDSSFIRPCPPSNVRRNSDINVKEVEVEGDVEGEFEVYDVVDAFHRDGWWIGVVKSVIVEGEKRRYVVEFENPYEEFDFEKSNLRFHVDWVDQRWVVPPKKTPDEVLGDKNASDDAQSGFTTPSNGTLVTHVDNVPVGPAPALSAKKNSRLRTRSRSQSQSRSEANSAVDISFTYSRSKRNGNLVESDSCRKRSKSSAGVKLKISRDGNVSGSARLGHWSKWACVGGKGNTKAIVPVLETSGSDDIHQDSPLVKHVITIKQTREAENGKSHQKRKRGRQSKIAVKEPIGSLEDGQEYSDVDEAPLSVWFKGLRPLSVLKKRSCLSPDNSLDQAVVASDAGVGTTTTNDYQQDWPFIKRAPIWVAIESLELYQKPPQKPHFSPLKKIKIDYREGLAIALMVTYGNLVQSFEHLQLNDSVDLINVNLETLCELETHGFDVGLVRGRFNELLSLNSKVAPHKDRRKEIENELEKCNREKSEADKEMGRLEAKMQALKEKTAQTAAMRKTKEEESVRLHTNLDLVSKEINDWEVAFEKLCKKDLTSA